MLILTPSLTLPKGREPSLPAAAAARQSKAKGGERKKGAYEKHFLQNIEVRRFYGLPSNNGTADRLRIQTIRNGN